MSPEKQRIAIAEACGWDFDPVEGHGWGSRGRWAKSPKSEHLVFANSVPDYLNDLNAMHEAVMSCREHLDSYPMNLRRIIRAEMPDGDDIDYYHATAAQRAEAFLKTLNKWTDQ